MKATPGSTEAGKAAPPSSLEELNRMIADEPPLPGFAPRPVFGEGPAGARLLFVGEQPGHQEEIEGRPFVGPAGQLLATAMQSAGIERREVYLTNAVKHFKFTERGKRRIHAKPNASEVKHYRWWLMNEINLVSPRLIVGLGATAALALTGKRVAITRARGPTMLEDRPAFITVHPSYLLRLRGETRCVAMERFVDDLRQVRRLGDSNEPPALLASG